MLVAVGCGTDAGGAPTFAPDVAGSVAVSGSSTVEPISVRVAERLARENERIAVDVDGPGTGDGFKLFCQGDTDISDASRPIKQEEIDACAAAGVEFVELKIANDGITVLTNTANDVECLALADLYALLGPESEGFDTWKDAERLARERGSSTAMPDVTLEITAPGEESGTYDAFVELALDGEAARKDYTSQANDDAILQGIQGSEGALGWVGFAFAQYAEGLVKPIDVRDADGTCVTPSAKTIADGSYPLSRPLFIYVNKAEAASNPALAAYVDYYLDEGYLAVEEVGYVPLGDRELARTRQLWDARVTGVAQ